MMFMYRSICALMFLTWSSAAFSQPIPSSFSPVTIVSTAGTTSVTNTTSETDLAALKIPAGTLGPNGAADVRCVFSYTNSANNKTMRFRFNTTAGDVSTNLLTSAVVATTTATSSQEAIIRNNNSTSVQTFFAPIATAPYGSTSNSIGSFALDTTADTYINISGQLAVGTETLTLQHCFVTVFYSP